MNAEALVLLDTDKIKNYVFTTNKLKEIRGASAILDELNLESTYQILDSEFGKGNYCKVSEEWKYNCQTIEKNKIDWEVIFLGGGSGKILFANEERARKFCRKIQEKYRKETDNAASITAVFVSQLDNECLKHWIYRGEKELRKQKDSKYRRLQPLTNQYFKICESTGLLPAEKTDFGEIISMSSFNKREEAKKARSYFVQFKKWLEKQQNEEFESKWEKVIKTQFRDNEVNKEWEDLLPEDLNTIGDLSNGYVGFIYADGNRMGTRLMELAESEDTERYREFSDKVKLGNQNALFNAFAESLKNTDKQHIPFEILLLGGDDLMVVVPANKAVKIARDFCEKFKSCTTYESGSGEETNVSICAGVLITHANYPIYRMMDHAEELLKSAKKLSYKKYREAKAASKPKKDWEINVIDFMVLKGALLQNLKDMRNNELSYHSDDYMSGDADLILYQRPYTINKLDNLISWIKRFKESNFPHNKLKSMYESLYHGKAQATLDYLLMTSRLSKSSDSGESPRDVMLDFKCKWEGGIDLLPWKTDETSGGYVTPFIDLIELYDFIEEEGQSE